MKIKMKRLFGILLSFVLALGLMPGMSLTAFAAEETLLTTLTFGGSSTYSETTSGVVSVTATNVTHYSSTYGWLWFEEGSLSVTAEEGYTITKCVFRQNGKTPITDTEAPFEIHSVDWGYIAEDPSWDMDGVTSIEVYGPATQTTVAVTGVSLNKTTTTLTVGDTETLTATVSPDDASDKSVTWSSSDTDVATVENGVVTAVAEGTANITVTATNGTVDTSDDQTATCAVTVNAATPSVVNVTEVEINKTSTTLTVGGTETLTATVSPDDATDKTVTWSSDNTAVATVSDGVVTAVAEGTANITVTATNGTDDTSDDKTATCAVTVNATSSGGDSSDSGNGDSSDSGNSNSEPKAETPNDYLEPLRGELKAEIALGGERTVTWDQGTALPYDIMKTLQDNPGVTLIFSYTYQGIDYKVTISGKDAKAYTEIPWYGPLYLYEHYGLSSETAPANTTDTTTGERTYTVLPGDTLIGLAGKLNTTVESLVSLNDIKNRDFILVGQILKY